MPKRLVILDGYSLLYRAFFATRYMSTSDGRPTNALYGFIGMLFYILEHDEPQAIVVALDAPGKTFRHAAYEEYKGTRRETAAELVIQLKESRELIAALGIPTVEVTGFEADDVVGTISKLGEQNGYLTTIVTGDLDSLQLVDEFVSVMTNKVGVSEVEVYNPEKVQQRYGFEPKLIPDYKAIVGDTSDNIPGVPGIGAKGATDLITKWGTIENMLDHWDEIEPKYLKKMEPVRESILKSKWLATIVRDAPVTYEFQSFVLTQEQYDAAQAFFELYELRSHARRMPLALGKYRHGFDRTEPQPTEIKTESIEVNVSTCDSLAELQRWVGDRHFSVFFETVQSTVQETPQPVSPKKQETPDLFAAPAPAIVKAIPPKIAFVAIEREVRQCSEEVGLALIQHLPHQAVVHDAKPIFKSLLRRPDSKPLITPNSDIAFDSLMAGYVLQSGRSNYALRDLVQGYLEITPPTTGAQMAASLSLLESAMLNRLEKEGQTSVLREIEIPLIPILAEMEETGIDVDPNLFREFSKELEGEISRVATAIHEQAGVQFNIGSPKQLGDVLFEKLQIPGPKKTKTGYATGAEELQRIAPNHQICTDVLNWRELTKLKSTYADSLPKMISPDGRIHTSFNQTVAATGRLSSNDPNLQNIPNRSELGRTIRRAFVAAPGYRFASFDYSQIELRVLAHMCGDENLVRAFAERVDVHAATAALMWGLPESEISKQQRGFAKTLNFAVLYGVTEYGLANQLGGGFSISEAKALIDQYRERFPKVKSFTDSVIAEARSKGFTTTLCGRRRYFPDIHNANRNERMYAERQAMNAPIQGTASDMIKLAMIKVAERLSRPSVEAGLPRTRLLLQVHDELLFELADGEDYLLEPIRADMEGALELSVPIEVDLKTGPNWDEMAASPRPTLSSV